ncbi:MAG: sigma-70 family RNA polymerase sigma factor, partial [Planctomycetes bacterium]|nr:sigma-70 family RNA polymerase sigma factor [Planctomycetota bacterium]
MRRFPLLVGPFAPRASRVRGAACRRPAWGHNRGLPRRAPFLDDNTRNLVSRALEQDRDAIDQLFQRYRDRLRAALRKLIGPKYRALLADSEDATQDAILSALKRLHQFEYRGDGSFLAWLLKGAEYEIVRRIRAIETQKRSAHGGLVPIDEARRKSKHRSRTTRDPPPRCYPLRATPSTRPQPPARTDPRPHAAAFPPREHTAPPPRPASGRNFAPHRHSAAPPS